MKIRYSLVSNSSSSSFIINADQYEDELVWDNSAQILALNVYCLDMYVKEEMSEEVIKICEKIVGEKEVDVDGVCDWTDGLFRLCISIPSDTVHERVKIYQQILPALKGKYERLRFCTGGTSSECEPQIEVQCLFIDLGITDYEVMGDGSFDIRKIEDITEIIHNDAAPLGATGWALRYALEKLQKKD